MVQQMDRSDRSLARGLGSALLTLVVLAAVALALAVAVVPAVSGGTTLTILSGSMEPTLGVGSVVVIRPRPAGRIAEGDIITFTARDEATGESRTVTHRVLDVLPGPEFRTKGDANEEEDPGLIAAADVQGVEWYTIPHVGRLAEDLRTPAGLVVGGGVLLLIIGGVLLVGGGSQRRDAGRS